MKTSTKLTFLSYLLFTIATHLIPTISAQTFPSDPVFDTTGKEVRRDAAYYILPADTSNAGGLTLQVSPSGGCPYQIIQTLNKTSNGFPLRFSPISTDNVVRVNVESNVQFVNVGLPLHCPQSNVWRLSNGSPPLFVTTGGAIGNPSPQTVSNWFRIQKYEDAYKIEFCPTPDFCPPGVLCKFLCGDIGIFVENGRRRLAEGQPTFKVVFKRV